MRQACTPAFRITILSFLLFFITYSEHGFGQAASATWALTGNASAVVTGNVTAGAATGGSAVTGWPTTTTCGSYCSNMSLASFSTGTNQYIEFTISPTSGNVLTVNTLLLHTNATSSSGTCCPTGCDIAAYYSLNGFATAGTLFTGALGTTGDDGNCTLSQQDSYSVGGVSVPNGGTMTIRVYCFAMNTNSDRFYIGNVVISGTTTSSCSAPTITSFTPTSACSGSGSIITINGANYTSGTTSVTINGATATPVTFVNSGQITVPLPAGASGTGNIVVTTSCSPVTSSSTFTVSTAPATPGPVSGHALVCSGSFDTLSIAAVSGATSYTWSLPGGWTGTSSSTSIVATAGASGGIVSVIANNNCGNSAVQVFTTVIASTPATPGAISGRTSVCSGGLDTFSIAAVNGATTYTWSLPSGWSGSSTTNTIVATAGASGGTVSVTAGNSCGTSSPQIFTVGISAPAPATPGVISGRAILCSGALDTLSIAAVSGATSYTWSLPGGWTGTSTTTSIIATTGATGGTVSVTANNGCGSSAAQIFTVVLNTVPATPAAITGRNGLCTGNLDTFSIPAVSGATSYTWTLPSGWSGTSATTTIIATAGLTGGAVTVTANNGCGSSSPQTFAVSMGSSPAMPGSITGRAIICAGSRDTFSIAAVSGATSYTWSLPSGWSGTSTTTSIIATTSSNSGIVSVTANSCGSSAAQLFTVVVNTAPATPGAISGRAAICGSGLDTFSIAPVNGATSYTWSLPSGWSGSSTTTTIIATTNATGGTVSVTANGACGSSTAATLAVSINSVPASPGTISGSGIVCGGGRDTFSIAAVSGATSYTWSLPGGWTGSSATTSIIATTNSTAGIVSVTANNSCGHSAAQVFTVVVSTAPATPGVISGHSGVCNGRLDTFAIAPVAGATSYVWTVPGGWSGASATTSIVVTTGTTGGAITVAARNSCGTSSPQTKIDSILPTPQVTFNISSGPVCISRNPTISLSGTPAGGTFNGQGVSGNIFDASTLTAGTYELFYTVTNSAGCTGIDTALVTVTNCTGIDNVSANNISVYPNPFTGDINIHTDGGLGNGTVIIFDEMGREIKKQDFAAGAIDTQIVTNSLASGPYWMIIFADGKRIVAKKLFRME